MARPPETPPAAKQGGRGAAVVVTLIILAILGLSAWYLSVPTSLLIQGEADSTRIDMDIGTSLTLTTSGGPPIPARVTELRRLGDFATWRAARAVGDHDLNTFAVRADPNGPVDGLEPGMTVWISAP